MNAVPCSVCGYEAPEGTCPHCQGEPQERSLAGPRAGLFGGIVAGFLAVPTGLFILASTRGVKRWLVPPFVLTTLLFLLLFGWTFGALDSWIDSALPEGPMLDLSANWIEELSEGWSWLKSTWAFLAAALEWVLMRLYALLTSQALRVVSWFLIGSLVVWYCFSIAYEALAGPFLDEVHARLEKRWFGADPRSRLTRPNDIVPSRCAALSLRAGLIASVLVIATWWLPLIPGWLAILWVPLPFLFEARRDSRYGEWLRWVGGIELRALKASFLASFLTAILLVFALPLYFVPVIGYVLFALVAGFATAISLLDIAFERRGWPTRLRMRFLGRHLPALTAFGITSGLLLAVPILGPILMVPAASIGGLWLLCRVDKSHLRRNRREPARAR